MDRLVRLRLRLRLCRTDEFLYDKTDRLVRLRRVVLVTDLVNDLLEDFTDIDNINDINELFWGYLYPLFETLLRLISSKRPIDNAMLPSFDKPGGGGAP